MKLFYRHSLLIVSTSVKELTAVRELHFHSANSCFVRQYFDGFYLAVLENVCSLAVLDLGADKRHTSWSGIFDHFVNVIIIVQKLILLNQHLLISVFESVHLYRQLKAVNSFFIMANHERSSLRELFLDVTHHTELPKVRLFEIIRPE